MGKPVWKVTIEVNSHPPRIAFATPPLVYPAFTFSKGQFINGTKHKALPGIVDAATIIRRSVIVVLTQAAIDVAAFLGVMVGRAISPRYIRL